MSKPTSKADLFKLWIDAISTPRKANYYGANWAVYYRALNDYEKRMGTYYKNKAQRRKQLLEYYNKLQRMLRVKRLKEARQQRIKRIAKAQELSAAAKRKAFLDRVDEDLIEGLRSFHTPKRKYGGRFYPRPTINYRYVKGKFVK